VEKRKRLRDFKFEEFPSVLAVDSGGNVTDDSGIVTGDSRDITQNVTNKTE